MDLFEFEAILVYIASCGTARVIQRDAVSKEQASKQARHSLGIQKEMCAHVPDHRSVRAHGQEGLEVGSPLS